MRGRREISLDGGVLGCRHHALTDVPLRVQEDDVELGREQTNEGHRRREGDGDRGGCDAQLGVVMRGY